MIGCLLTSPCHRQGFLSRVHDSLVSRRALIPIAQHLGIQRFMIASGRTMINGAGEPFSMPTSGCWHAHRPQAGPGSCSAQEPAITENHFDMSSRACGLCPGPPWLAC